MLIGQRQWHAAPDDSIESWCFLVVERECDTDGQWISGWELGWGNSVQLLRRESSSITSRDEEEGLLRGLDGILDPDRYQGVTLVTCCESVVALLRTRFAVTCQQPRPTLRGFLHIPVKAIVQRYFSSEIWAVHPFDTVVESRTFQTSTDGVDEVTDRVKSLWRVVNIIGPLVPSEVFHGVPL